MPSMRINQVIVKPFIFLVIGMLLANLPGPPGLSRCPTKTIVFQNDTAPLGWGTVRRRYFWAMAGGMPGGLFW